MHGKRFDALTKTWGRTAGTSRRGVLALLGAFTFGLGREPHQAVVAQEVGAERISCRGRCAEGQVCKHGACLDRCATPGTCSGGGSGGPPPCGPAGANCACVATRTGAGFCLAASKSTPEGNGCISKGCQRNRDCAKGQVCAHVSGCCPNKARICAIPCPEAVPEVSQAGAFGG